MIKLVGDQLELVDLIDTFGDRDCGWSHAQDLHLDVQALASPPWPIVATVHDSLTLTGEDCEGRAVPMRSSHEIALTYTWSAASGRYERDSDAFLRLADENADRF